MRGWQAYLSSSLKSGTLGRMAFRLWMINALANFSGRVSSFHLVVLPLPPMYWIYGFNVSVLSGITLESFLPCMADRLSQAWSMYFRFKGNTHSYARSSSCTWFPDLCLIWAKNLREDMQQWPLCYGTYHLPIIDQGESTYTSQRCLFEYQAIRATLLKILV